MSEQPSPDDLEITHTHTHTHGFFGIPQTHILRGIGTSILTTENGKKM